MRYDDVMIQATCHCGSVKFEFQAAPGEVNEYTRAICLRRCDNASA
jgi:hypothetical protein